MPVAELLGVVSSIIAIVQISKAIISACQFYIDAVKGSSSDLGMILVEVSTVKAIAKSLQYLTQPNVTNSALLEQLAVITGPLGDCAEALKDLETLFPPTADSANSSGQGPRLRKRDAAVSALAWPRKAGKAKKLLKDIMRYKETINLALTAELVYALIYLRARTLI